MMADHERLEELIVARALGGLDPDDEREYERQRAEHGADCAECRRLEAEYADVAGRLAFTLDPEPVSRELEDRVVALATNPATVTVPEAPATSATSDDLAQRRAESERRGGGSLARTFVAIAAAFVLFVGGWAIGSATSGGDPSIPADARVVAFEGTDTGDATLSVAYTPGEPGVYVLGSGLPEPSGDEVYEVWMIQDGQPVPGPCLRPEADGSLFAFADAELGTTEAMAVTVESSSCPSAPTSDPVFTATIV
jgi:hypothetical protein